MNMSTNLPEPTPREVEIDEESKRMRRSWPEQDAFFHGAKWADAHPQSPWVSVKERLPNVDRDLFGDVVSPSALVLTASLAKGVSVNRWNGREWLYIGDVDYLMPIPKIPK